MRNGGSEVNKNTAFTVIDFNVTLLHNIQLLQGQGVLRIINISNKILNRIEIIYPEDIQMQS